jgi:ligand-binding SRPBCC domain-containing protein
MHRVVSTQNVPITVEKAWQFFATPVNLKKVTPPKMQMKMLDDFEGEMYEGQIIRYKVAPLAGISLPWASEITRIKKHQYFVDSMLEGPFSIWHHQHHFSPISGGTQIKDVVHYKVPLGILGELFHPLLVKKNVAEIFEYRNKQIETLFGKAEN